MAMLLLRPKALIVVVTGLLDQTNVSFVKVYAKVTKCHEKYAVIVDSAALTESASGLGRY